MAITPQIASPMCSNMISTGAMNPNLDRVFCNANHFKDLISTPQIRPSPLYLPALVEVKGVADTIRHFDRQHLRRRLVGNMGNVGGLLLTVFGIVSPNRRTKRQHLDSLDNPALNFAFSKHGVDSRLSEQCQPLPTDSCPSDAASRSRVCDS